MSNGDYSFDESAVRTIYSNVVQVTKSPLDVSILFARVTLPSKLVGSPRGDVPVEDVVQVYMSPQQAKVLTRLLVAHMEEYEEKFGHGIDTGGTVTVTVSKPEDAETDESDEKGEAGK